MFSDYELSLIDELQEVQPEEINEELVHAFERVYDKKLVSVHETYENLVREPAYVFNDGLGGYTIKGIIASLKENRFFD